MLHSATSGQKILRADNININWIIRQVSHHQHLHRFPSDWTPYFSSKVARRTAKRRMHISAMFRLHDVSSKWSDPAGVGNTLCLDSA